MAKRYSVCINIEGLLSQCKTAKQTERQLTGLLTNEKGRTLYPAEAKNFLQNELNQGRRLMPCNGVCGNPCGNADKGCTGFDYQESGCAGFEVKND